MIIQFLEEKKVKLKTKAVNKIIIHCDDSCSMRKVTVNNRLIMMGNNWDFHPGCHGFPFNFRGADDLANVLMRAIKKSGMPCEITTKEWIYK